MISGNSNTQALSPGLTANIKLSGKKCPFLRVRKQTCLNFRLFLSYQGDLT